MQAFRDDPSISDDSALWRRISPKWIVPDESGSGYRISSQAFQNHPADESMSVHLAEEMARNGLSASDAVKAFPGYSLVSITAGLARECSQRVARDPLPDDPAHAVVDGKKTKAVRRRFSNEARWVIPPVS